MKHVSVVFLLAVQLVLSGCNTMHSLSRTAVTNEPLPATDDVVQTLKRVHGVTSVEVVHMPSHSCIALAYGPMKTSPYDKVLVSRENVLVVLSLGGEQGYIVGFSALWSKHQPTETERWAAATLMDAIYDALASRFPSFPPKAGFKESCDGLPTQTAALGRGP